MKLSMLFTRLAAASVAAVTIQAVATADFDVQRAHAQEPTPTPSSSGSVVTTVDATEAPGPCLLLSTDNIDYGTLAFSTPFTSRSGEAQVTVTNCHEEPEDILARGADAAGASAAWTLTDPPAAGNMCDGLGAGINRFAHVLNDGAADLVLTAVNQTFQSGTDANAEVVTATRLLMPCSGSTGAGELISTSITFTAVTPSS